MHSVVKYGQHSTHLSTLVFGLLILFTILILIDVYVYKGVQAAFSKSSSLARRGVSILYWSLNSCFLALGIYLVFTFSSSSNSTGIPFKLFAASFVILYAPKLLFGLFLLAEDFYRLLRAIGLGIYGMAKKNPASTVKYFPSRRRFISQAAALAAGIPFAGSIYGVIKGKYNFKVHKAQLAFKNLPKEFDGFTITQISDIHAGSFGNLNEVMKGVNLANAQNSNIMFFTGDLVNFRSSEMDSWLEVFKQFKAPMGVYSILGNHDYGDYAQWNSEAEKQANLDNLCKIHSMLGFQLLRNENVKIKKGNAGIELLGVENWGRGGFSKYGDLDKAFIGTSPGSFKILLSHDPTHWEEKVMNDVRMIPLTFSGHTHGVQFGFEIPGIRFSPVQFRYKRWAGLYVENNRYLYVNRGFGYIGFPGRVGIWPEITVVTLKCS